MNVSVLRTEIKCWERDFRNEHGRDPQVQDIRDRPHIADKYKLYKKLSKAKPSAHADPPSTPPKPQPKSLISKSRAVKTQAPAISNNPFSPVKNGTKHKQIKHDDPHGVPNPFATPVKNVQAYREASPDPFPLVQPSQVASSSQLILAPPRNSAISKARKRLRGEPVSPSPVKVKRQRVTSQISLQLTHDNGGTFGSDDNTTDEDAAEANSSFVADSPVKTPAGSKSFLSLFTENPNTVLDKPVGSKRTLSRSDTRAGLFDRAASVFSDDGTGTAGLFGKQMAQTTRPKKTGKIQNQPLSKGFAPNQSDATRHVRKRSLSDSEMDDASAAEPKAPILIPPSPPPISSTQNNRYDIKAKHKVKAKNNRKKPKISANPDDEAEDEDSQEGEEEKVKVIDWRLNRRKDNEEQELWDDDEPLFRKRRRPSEENSGADPNTLEGDFIVNVPHDLLQVLAISPSKSGRPQEDRIVRALLHGTRAGHYDGNRGGHIWDVGETEGDEDALTERWHGKCEEGMHGSNAVDEGDDDEWEGEAVPWQAAEL